MREWRNRCFLCVAVLRNKEKTWYFEESLFLSSSFFPLSVPESQQQVDKEEEKKESQMVAPFFSSLEMKGLYFGTLSFHPSPFLLSFSPLYCIGGRNTSILLPLHLLLLFWYYILPYAQSLFRQKWLEGGRGKESECSKFFYTFVCRLQQATSPPSPNNRNTALECVWACFVPAGSKASSSQSLPATSSEFFAAG